MKAKKRSPNGSFFVVIVKKSSFQRKKMKTLTLNIPDTLDVDNNDLAMIVASRLYEQGRLSLGEAAAIAGLTKRTFAELLGRYGVSIFNFPAADLSKDIANA
jgi:predicted HTH domain antitoxin